MCMCAPVDVVINDDKFGFIKPLVYRVDEYLQLLNDDNITKHFTQAKDIPNMSEDDFLDKASSCNIIVLTHRDKCIITDFFGIIKVVPKAHGAVEILIAIKPEEQHKGYGLYCLNKVVGYLYADKDVSSIHAKCFTTDIVAGEFLKKCGFEMKSMAHGTFYFKHAE